MDLLLLCKVILITSSHPIHRHRPNQDDVLRGWSPDLHAFALGEKQKRPNPPIDLSRMLSKRQEIYHLIKGSLLSGKGKYFILLSERRCLTQ